MLLYNSYTAYIQRFKLFVQLFERLVFVLVEIEVFRAEWIRYILCTVLYMEAVVFHIGGGAVQLHKLVILL